MKKIVSLSCLLLLLNLLLAASLIAEEKNGLSKGQTVYVPAYSHIYSGDQEKPFYLTITLSIRNIDPKHQIKITAVDYCETQGKLIKNHIEDPFVLNPLASKRYVVPQKDKSGGSGAYFIVKWQSKSLMNPPVVESIMIGTQSQQGVSFTSRGQVILTSIKK